MKLLLIQLNAYNRVGFILFYQIQRHIYAFLALIQLNFQNITNITINPLNLFPINQYRMELSISSIRPIVLLPIKKSNISLQSGLFQCLIITQKTGLKFTPPKIVVFPMYTFQCRECIIWFSCTKTSNFVHDNDQFRPKLSHLLNNYAFRV